MAEPYPGQGDYTVVGKLVYIFKKVELQLAIATYTPDQSSLDSSRHTLRVAKARRATRHLSGRRGSFGFTSQYPPRLVTSR